MTIAKVQQNTGNNAGGTTVALTGVTAGSTLVIQISYFRLGNGAAPAAPTDSNGTVSTARNDAPAQLGGNDVGTGIFYVYNAASGTHTITPNSGLTSWECSVTEFSGLTTTDPLDASAGAKTENSTITSQVTGTTAATAQANELIIIGLGLAAGGVTNVGFSTPSGFTNLLVVADDANDIGTYHAYKTVSATGAQSSTFNWTDNEAGQTAQGAIATFKAAAGGGGTPVPVLLNDLRQQGIAA